jgi:hypothetical protein
MGVRSQTKWWRRYTSANSVGKAGSGGKHSWLECRGCLIKKRHRVYVGSNGAVSQEAINWRNTWQRNWWAFGYIGNLPKAEKKPLPGMKQEVWEVVRNCDVCQISKSENVASPCQLNQCPSLLYYMSVEWKRVLGKPTPTKLHAVSNLLNLPNDHGMIVAECAKTV